MKKNFQKMLILVFEVIMQPHKHRFEIGIFLAHHYELVKNLKMLTFYTADFFLQDVCPFFIVNDPL